MKLDETVTYGGLEGMPLCGSVPIQSACTLWLWRDCWIDVNRSHVFSEGVLTAIRLVAGGTRAGGAGARTRFEPVLPLCSVAITALQGWVRSQVAGAEALRFGSELALFPSSVCSPAPALASPPQRGAVLEQEGLGWALSMGRGGVFGGPPVVRDPDYF